MTGIPDLSSHLKRTEEKKIITSSLLLNPQESSVIIEDEDIEEFDVRILLPFGEDIVTYI